MFTNSAIVDVDMAKTRLDIYKKNRSLMLLCLKPDQMFTNSPIFDDATAKTRPDVYKKYDG